MENKSKFCHLTKKWVEMYNNGESYEKIGKIYGCGKSVVRRRVIKQGKAMGLEINIERINISARTRHYISPEDIFNSLVIKNKINCWGWSGNVDSGGYGMFVFNKKIVLAHRFSYELYCSQHTDGLLVCHKCDNPICVNPDHLFLGTKRDNSIDYLKKGRLKNATLPVFKILEIKDLIKNTTMDNKEISQKFGVKTSYIYNIRKGKIWKFL